MLIGWLVWGIRLCWWLRILVWFHYSVVSFIVLFGCWENAGEPFAFVILNYLGIYVVWGPSNKAVYFGLRWKTSLKNQDKIWDHFIFRFQGNQVDYFWCSVPLFTPPKKMISKMQIKQANMKKKCYIVQKPNSMVFNFSLEFFY